MAAWDIYQYFNCNMDNVFETDLSIRLKFSIFLNGIKVLQTGVPIIRLQYSTL